MNLQRIACLGLFAALVFTGCASPRHADRGALLGGVTGAGVGALVGKATGNTPAGAVIGAAVGTIAGAAIGESVDEEIDRARVEAQIGRQLAAQATIGDVLAMSQAGVGDNVIIAHIQTSGVSQKPSPEDVIYLKNSGVSDAVVLAMLKAPLPGVVYKPAPAPVVVEEHYYSDCHSPYWRHYHFGHGHRRHGSRVSWGVSFAN